MKKYVSIIAILFLVGAVSCKKEEITNEEPQVTEYMDAVGLEFKSVTDFTKSATTRFEAATVVVSKYTDGNGVDILLVEGLTAFSQSQATISLYIPYTGIGSYSANNTSVRVVYHQGSFTYHSTYGGGGAFIEVLKDENGMVEGTFRYVAVSSQSNATPYVIGHDDGVFKAKVD